MVADLIPLKGKKINWYILSCDIKPGFKAKPSEKLERKSFAHRAFHGPPPLLLHHVKNKQSSCTIALYVDKVIYTAAGKNIIEFTKSLEELVGHPSYLMPLFLMELPYSYSFNDIRSIVFCNSTNQNQLLI